MLRMLYFLATVLSAPFLLVLRRIGSIWSVRGLRTQRTNLQKIAIDRSDGNDGFSPSPLLGRPCQRPHVYPGLSYCDASLSKEERIRDLLDCLTREEKISLLGHDSPAINRPGVYLPAYMWWNEGLHGMAWTDCCERNKWKNVTVFPQVMGLATAWNRTLWSQVGGAIGDEAVQRMHSRVEPGGSHPGLTFFTPNVNIFRDPRWGRGQETPGEDPFLTSHYAATMVMSLQYGHEYVKQLAHEPADSGADTDLWRPRIAATCKHYAAYSLETGRLNFSADIDDQRDWNDTYLPAFQACTHAEQFLHEHYGAKNRHSALVGGALGIMCSYNAIDGIPACANLALLQDRLRGKWNFSGYVVSDCWAIHNIYDKHYFATSKQEAAGMAVRAGVDLDCGDTIQGYGMKALEEGQMDIDDVDKALSNLFGVLFDLGYFAEEDSARLDTEENELQKRYHDELAFEAAVQSLVLLKNWPGEASLPLSITKHRNVTLIGPLGDDKEVPLANYHGMPSFVTTPLQGLQDLGVEVEYIWGCNVTDSALLERDQTICEQMSATSDATILTVGLHQAIEAEDIDRTSLLLPKGQRELIEEASRCSKARNPSVPVILVVMSGGPVDLSRYKTNDNIDAMLYTSYPGQSGGKALSHVLYGKYNPSGRLVTTMLSESFLNEVALGDMRMRPDQSYPGRTYRFYQGSGAVYPFGHGLSYSSFDYSVQASSKGTKFNDDDSISVSVISVKVSNKGPMDGSETVLLFHKGPNSGQNGNPLKSLVGFEKVFVLSGSTKLVRFNVEKWMKEQSPGLHSFLVGPSLNHVVQINSLGDGAVE